MVNFDKTLFNVALWLCCNIKNTSSWHLTASSYSSLRFPGTSNSNRGSVNPPSRLAGVANLPFRWSVEMLRFEENPNQIYKYFFFFFSVVSFIRLNCLDVNCSFLTPKYTVCDLDAAQIEQHNKKTIFSAYSEQFAVVTSSFLFFVYVKTVFSDIMYKAS